MVNTLPSLDLTHHSDFDALASSPSAATVPSSPEIAGLSVEPCDGEIVVVAVFKIKKTEVVPESLDGKPFTNPARDTVEGAMKNKLSSREPYSMKGTEIKYV
ncbi:hypothetical protein JHK85_046871 [Glycine max]|nr:hypothetical protein JHK85_046871 [Glycine max]